MPGAAVLGWLALAASYYLALPLFGALSLAALLVRIGCWLLAVVASVLVVTAELRRRAYRWAGVAAVAAILAGTGVVRTDWPRLYVDSQFRLHRGGLDALAAEYRTGRLTSDVPLPWRLRYLSIDGRAHVQDRALYLPAWQDWRAESGGGFAYFTTCPDPDTLIITATGDVGTPQRALGDGWWWVGQRSGSPVPPPA